MNINIVRCDGCKYYVEKHVSFANEGHVVGGFILRTCTREKEREWEQIPDWCDWCSAGERKMEGEQQCK